MKKIIQLFQMLEIVFFKFVRWIGLVGATLVITISIILAMVTYSKYSTSVDDDIVNPEVSFSQYNDIINKQAEADKASKSKVVESDDKKIVSKPETKIDELTEKMNQYHSEVYSLLSQSAKIAQNQELSEIGLENYLYKSYIDYPNNDLKIRFMSELKEASSDFLNNTKEIKKSNSNKFISEIEFITWFTTEFNTQVNDEVQRIEAEEEQVLLNKMSATANLPIIGALFGIFLLLVLVLVLLKIERNTRVENNLKESSK